MPDHPVLIYQQRYPARHVATLNATIRIANQQEGDPFRLNKALVGFYGIRTNAQNLDVLCSTLLRELVQHLYFVASARGEVGIIKCEHDRAAGIEV